jgi:hypothetical protein
MQYSITLERVSDGASAEFQENWNYSESSLLFQWTENNYSCNCNRELFFARARKEPEPGDRLCGEGAFFLTIRQGDRVVYSDNPKVA